MSYLSDRDQSRVRALAIAASLVLNTIAGLAAFAKAARVDPIRAIAGT